MQTRDARRRPRRRRAAPHIPYLYLWGQAGLAPRGVRRYYFDVYDDLAEQGPSRCTYVVRMMLLSLRGTGDDLVFECTLGALVHALFGERSRPRDVADE